MQDSLTYSWYRTRIRAANFCHYAQITDANCYSEGCVSSQQVVLTPVDSLELPIL